MDKFSLKPPNKTSFISPEEFIAAAGKTVEEVIEDRVDSVVMPWEKDGVRKKARVGFNLRLLEPYHLKISWLSERDEKSKSKIIEEILYPQIDKAIDKEMKKLGINKNEN